jgi:hypothetical protein
LQGRAAGRAALAFAMRTNVGGVRHGPAAVRAGFEFFFERQAAVWTFCIDGADLVSTFRTSQRPRLAAVEAGRGTGRHRLVTVRTKFLAAVITHISIAGQFGKTGGTFHGSPHKWRGKLPTCPTLFARSHSSTKRQSVDNPPQADILSRTASQPLPTLGVSFHSTPIAQGEPAGGATR